MVFFLRVDIPDGGSVGRAGEDGSDGLEGGALAVVDVVVSMLAVAANAVRENEGGLAIAVDGRVLSTLPLPIGGLMCDRDAEYVEDKLIEMKAQARLLGVPDGIDPFMTLAFMALPVIPKLRILTKGLADVDTQSYVPVLFE